MLCLGLIQVEERRFLRPRCLACPVRHGRKLRGGKTRILFDECSVIRRDHDGGLMVNVFFRTTAFSSSACWGYTSTVASSTHNNSSSSVVKSPVQVSGTI